ncbi:MAG: hypothetical protein U0271_47530 [Polyangiaceae bacterium]
MADQALAESLTVRACRLGELPACLALRDGFLQQQPPTGLEFEEVQTLVGAAAKAVCTSGIVRGCMVADPDKHSYREWLEHMCEQHDVSACHTRAVSPQATTWGELEKYSALENVALLATCEKDDDATSCEYYAHHADTWAEQTRDAAELGKHGIDLAKVDVVREKAVRLFEEQCQLGFPPSCVEACLMLRDRNPARAKELVERACALGDTTTCRRAELGWPWR